MKRLRRLRNSGVIRDLMAQTKIAPSNLIMPYFAVEGSGKKEEIKSMPGVYRLSIDKILKDIEELKGLGIKGVLIFGIPDRKDKFGSQAYSKNGVVQKTIRSIKDNIDDIAVMTDVCLCGYTAHGHCGIIRAKSKEQRAKRKGQRAKDKEENSRLYALGSMLVDNDATLKILAKVALSHAEAGADFVAPSAMMDGQVKAIRESLDKRGFKDVGILAYSAKYASNFYGPFREALDSTPQFGDRRGYQMDFRNSDEALREIRQDIDEGADIVMVKPALSYLDIIYRTKSQFNVPVAAYNVSGEYSMVKAYCQKPETSPSIALRTGTERSRSARVQKPDIEKELALEILTSIRRAGADLIITYWAKDAAGWLR